MNRVEHCTFTLVYTDDLEIEVKNMNGLGESEPVPKLGLTDLSETDLPYLEVVARNAKGEIVADISAANCRPGRLTAESRSLLGSSLHIRRRCSRDHGKCQRFPRRRRIPVLSRRCVRRLR